MLKQVPTLCKLDFMEGSQMRSIDKARTARRGRFRTITFISHQVALMDSHIQDAWLECGVDGSHDSCEANRPGGTHGEVQGVVLVKLHRLTVRFLQVYEEARYEDGVETGNGVRTSISSTQRTVKPVARTGQSLLVV